MGYRKNKKGLSEVVSYVLLIVVAISISAGVYVWMKNYIPKDTFECPEDLALIISDYSCYEAVNGGVTENKLSVTLENAGLFSVSGFGLRASNDPDSLPIINLNVPGMEDVIGIPFTPELEPGERRTFIFDYTPYGDLFELQIIPIERYNDELYLCNRSKINYKTTTCS